MPSKPRKYKDDYLLCPFCNKQICINTYTCHLKTKSCKEFQNKDVDLENNLLTFKKLINGIKTNINQSV